MAGMLKMGNSRRTAPKGGGFARKGEIRSIAGYNSMTARARQDPETNDRLAAGVEEKGVSEPRFGRWGEKERDSKDNKALADFFPSPMSPRTNPGLNYFPGD